MGLITKRGHNIKVNANILFFNNAHVLFHQNRFWDLAHKSPEQGPPLPTDRDKSY